MRVSLTNDGPFLPLSISENLDIHFIRISLIHHGVNSSLCHYTVLAQCKTNKQPKNKLK